MKTMRRADRLISENEAKEILIREEYGILSTTDKEGKPYGIPLNYVFIDNNLYFHSALEGSKLVNISENPYVSFTVVGKTRVLPDKFGTLYESVLIEGVTEEVTLEKKQLVLESFLKKYSPDFMENGLAYIEKLFTKTAVIKIKIISLSGKSRRA